MITNTRSHLSPASEALADKLTKDPDYCVLRSLPKPFAAMPSNGTQPDGRSIVLLDVETTSLDAATGNIIEIAIKLLWVDQEGHLMGHFPIYS